MHTPYDYIPVTLQDVLRIQPCCGAYGNFGPCMAEGQCGLAVFCAGPAWSFRWRGEGAVNLGVRLPGGERAFFHGD